MMAYRALGNTINPTKRTIGLLREPGMVKPQGFDAADDPGRRFSCANASRRFCQVKYRLTTATQKPATESVFVKSNYAMIDWSIEITENWSIAITIANP